MTTSRTLTALAAAALSLSAPARADDLSELAGLLNEPVVSTASKSAETAGLAPATTSVITAEDLRRHGITSLDDAINFLALGLVTEPSYGTPEIGARGVLLSGDYGNHVLLLVDGHALNEPWDGTAYYDRSAGVPLDLVDHVEVILGPGSVLYGSSAMLGVINVITKRAKDYEGLHVVADGAFPATGHASGGFGKRFEWLGREAELTAAVEYAQVRGPRLAYDVQSAGGAAWGGAATHREIEVPAGHLRLVVGDLDVAIRAAQSKRYATQQWASFDDPNNWERDRWLSLDARWTRSLSPRAGVSLRLYGDLYDYLQNDPSASPLDCLDGQSRCVFKNSGVSRWGGAEASGTWDWLADGRYVTLLGVDARYRHVTSWASYDDADTGARTVVAPYDRSGSIVAAYVQQTLSPFAWLHVNLGARLDDDDQLGAHFSPRAAVVVPAWAGGTVKGVYSEAFRAPTFFERFYADRTLTVAAPDLQPETVRSVEASVEQRVGAQRLRVAAFRTWWNDLVVTVPLSDAQLADAVASGALDPGVTAAQKYANASRIDSYGVNADWDGSGRGQRLRYGASLTLAHSRQDASALAAAAQVFGNARVSYDLGGRLPVLALAARVVGPRPVAGTAFDPVPEAATRVEVRGAVSGPVGVGLSYFAAGGGALSGGSAYAVGPVRGPDAGFSAQPMLPLPRWQVMAGLRLDR